MSTPGVSPRAGGGVKGALKRRARQRFSRHAWSLFAPSTQAVARSAQRPLSAGAGGEARPAVLSAAAAEVLALPGRGARRARCRAGERLRHALATRLLHVHAHLALRPGVGLARRRAARVLAGLYLAAVLRLGETLAVALGHRRAVVANRHRHDRAHRIDVLARHAAVGRLRPRRLPGCLGQQRPVGEDAGIPGGVTARETQQHGEAEGGSHGVESIAKGEPRRTLPPP